MKLERRTAQNLKVDCDLSELGIEDAIRQMPLRPKRDYPYGCYYYLLCASQTMSVALQLCLYRSEMHVDLSLTYGIDEWMLTRRLWVEKEEYVDSVHSNGA